MAVNTKKAVEELISYTVVTDKSSLTDLLNRYGIIVSRMPSDAEVTTAVLVGNKKSKAFKKELSNLLTKKLPKAGEKFTNIVGNSQDFGFTGVDDVTYMKGFTGFDDFQTFTGVDDFVDSNGKAARQQRRATRKEAKTVRRAERKETRTLAQQQKALAKGLGGVGVSTPPIGGTRGKTRVGEALGSVWQFTKTNVLTPENVNAGISYGLNKINQDSLARENALQEKSLELQQQQDEIRNKAGVSVGLSGNTVLYIVVGVVALAGIGFLIFRQSKNNA